LDYWLNFTLIMETGQYMRETLTNRTFIVIRTLKTSAEEIILLLQKSDNYFSQFLIIGEFKFRWVTLLFLLLACCIGFLILFRRKNQKQKVYNFPVRNALIDSKQSPQIWNNRPIIFNYKQEESKRTEVLISQRRTVFTRHSLDTNIDYQMLLEDSADSLCNQLKKLKLSVDSKDMTDREDLRRRTFG